METVPGFWQPSWEDGTVTAAILSANGLAFVWADKTKILGFICAHDFAFRAYLSELVGDPGARRQGIATRLLSAVEDALCKKGQKILVADVWRDAEAFYKSLGWETPDVILLRRRLRTGVPPG